MEKVSRRFAIRAATAGAVVVGTAVLGDAVAGDGAKAPKLLTLEGELKVHPKFIYRYYLQLLGGQTCALYGSDHGREPAQLARIKRRVGVRVRGVLGTEHHPGGTKENPSPFPEGWTLYMDVHEVKVLNYLPPPSDGPPGPAPDRVRR
jgi:hypothetical protein